VGQGGTRSAHDAENVDVHHPVPLLVRVVLDAAHRADACVVHEDVQPTEPLDGLFHGGAHGGVVAHIGPETDQRFADAAGIEVEHGHCRALRRE